MTQRPDSAAGDGLRDYLVIAAVILVLGLLFTPVSPGVLDVLLVANIAMALTILLVTFQTDKPLEFSTFPSLLLVATLLRLALNISATRLILDQGYAGEVIEGIGSFVVGGNYVTGIVVFFILVVIQYVVVTNGAQRVAEVAARFTLDSMPGKQMAIDADLNMGLIDPAEAKARRAGIEREANFYGAMDGASKFVKGDAIAGILVILINIVGGLAIGVAQNGMEWGDALHRYTLLTVGDGIVTQIPSLVIAVATGIIITRAATDRRLGHEIVRQLFSNPRPVAIVAAALLAGLAFTSIPVMPVLLIATVLLSIAGWAWRARHVTTPETSGASTVDEDGPASAPASPLRLALGPALSRQLLAPASTLPLRLEGARQSISRDLGFALPPVIAATDTSLADDAYQFRIAGVTAGRYEMPEGRLLAIAGTRASTTIDGIATREPTYGIAATWIAPEQRVAARDAGHTVVEADRVLCTHVTELLRRQASTLLGRKAVEDMVGARREALGSLVDELVPAILSWSDVQRVLQLLLEEQVSIANLDLVLEELVDRGRQVRTPEELAERVRERLGMAIAERFLDAQGALHVITLAPALERRLAPGSDGMQPLSPAETDRLFTAIHALVERQLAMNVQPAILCTPSLRRVLRRLFARTLPHVPVLATVEVAQAAQLVSAGMLSLDEPARTARDAAQDVARSSASEVHAHA